MLYDYTNTSILVPVYYMNGGVCFRCIIYINMMRITSLSELLYLLKLVFILIASHRRVYIKFVKRTQCTNIFWCLRFLSLFKIAPAFLPLSSELRLLFKSVCSMRLSLLCSKQHKFICTLTCSHSRLSSELMFAIACASIGYKSKTFSPSDPLYRSPPKFV